jgi:VCBS repeat-containing protein
MFRAAFTALLGGLTLAACGGGGSGSSGSSSGGAANPPPVMSAQSFNGTEDAVLSGQLAAVDAGDTLTFSGSTAPAHGTVTVTSAGAFTYTPAANFSGSDSFTARVTDSLNQSVSATITLTLARVNDAPTATDDLLTVTSTSAVNVLANDVDPDGDNLAVSITSQPFTGGAVVNADRSVNLQLPAGFKGFTRFGYRVTDANGVTSDASALVFAGIQPFKILTVNPAPAGGGTSGIFVNNLVNTRLVHEDTITAATIVADSMVVAPSGRSLAFKNNAANGMELRFVDLANPGSSRLIHGPIAAGQEIGLVSVSADGRFVVYEFSSGAVTNGKQLNVFDRDAAGQGQRLSLPDAGQPMSRMGSFAPGGAAIYYTGFNSATQPWVCAVYKADLATRTVTRVSTENAAQTHAFIWPLPDDQRYVDIRFNNGGGMGAFLTTSAAPAGQTMLHEPLTEPNVYFPAELSRDGNYFLFTETSATFIGVRLGIARTSSPGTSRTVGGAGFGYAYAYSVMRPDSQAMLVSKDAGLGATMAIWEAPLATPETLTTVYSTTTPFTYFTNLQYSSDGDRVIYQVSNYAGAPTSALYVTRRDAFGQSIEVTPVANQLSAYRLDASGRVALVSLSGTPQTNYLVNLDAPLKLMPLGASFSSSGSLWVAPR